MGQTTKKWKRKEGIVGFGTSMYHNQLINQIAVVKITSLSFDTALASKVVGGATSGTV